MVLLIIIPIINGYFIGNINPTFSDKASSLSRFDLQHQTTADLNQCTSGACAAGTTHGPGTATISTMATMATMATACGAGEGAGTIRKVRKAAKAKAKGKGRKGRGSGKESIPSTLTKLRSKTIALSNWRRRLSWALAPVAWHSAAIFGWQTPLCR